MMDFADDQAFFRWICETLYVPAVCDALDSLGYQHQAMHQRLRPLDPDNCTFAGRARTARWMDIDYVVDDPYGEEIALLDSLRPGDVVVHSTDHVGRNAPWGELMSTVAKQHQVAGCVCDSLVRDCRKIMAMGFPVFHQGIRPVDSMPRAKVMAYDVPVMCGDVLVRPGELIFADFDGVVVIPKDVEEQALKIAKEKAEKESDSRRELRQGRSLREVYDRYGVL
jgi:regulator of RNase E activity RraA